MLFIGFILKQTDTCMVANSNKPWLVYCHPFTNAVACCTDGRLGGWVSLVASNEEERFAAAGITHISPSIKTEARGTLINTREPRDHQSLSHQPQTHIHLKMKWTKGRSLDWVSVRREVSFGVAVHHYPLVIHENLV